jgi:hypothetical protein
MSENYRPIGEFDYVGGRAGVFYDYAGQIMGVIFF